MCLVFERQLRSSHPSLSLFTWEAHIWVAVGFPPPLGRLLLHIILYLEYVLPKTSCSIHLYMQTLLRALAATRNCITLASPRLIHKHESTHLTLDLFFFFHFVSSPNVAAPHFHPCGTSGGTAQDEYLIVPTIATPAREEDTRADTRAPGAPHLAAFSMTLDFIPSAAPW